MKKNDSKFSVRRWAVEMELKGHPHLVMLLQGKRVIRIQHCKFLNKGLELNNNEQAYFQNLLVKDKQGKLIPTHNNITTKNDIINDGAKEYHRQVLSLAEDVINEQNLNEREFQSFTITVVQEKIPLVKDMIRKFRTKLIKAVSNNGDNVYQTSIHFFQLTRNPKNNFEDNGVAEDTDNLHQGEKK